VMNSASRFLKFLYFYDHQTMIMTTHDVANKFYELAQQGDWDGIQDQLFSQDAVSIEPDFAPQPRAEGMEAIKEKGKRFSETIEEVHSGYTNEPIVAGNHFSCTMGMDCTMKDVGRIQIDEVCVYEVKDGKIVKEQFFYPEGM